MICESCNKETNRIITEVADVKGRRVVVKYCPQCPVDTLEGKRYEKRLKRRRAGSSVEPRLRQGEIAATQRLKPSREVVAADRIRDARTRIIDHLSPEKEMIFVSGNGSRLSDFREHKIAQKANARFGAGNWRKIKDNGFEVVVQRSA